MLQQPFYDPQKSYEDNFTQGPFGALADGSVFKNIRAPKFKFLGKEIYLPFGIAAGPLVNGRFVKAALDYGFDLCVYKTVRTAKYPCHSWPNILGLDVNKQLTLEQAAAGVKVKPNFIEPLSVTNSFGVPSMDVDFWQKDMADSVAYAKPGQVVIGSFQGTPKGDSAAYVKDFAVCARLVKETGAKVLEVNFSCPNEGTDKLLCFDLERVSLVVEAIKNEIGNTPLIIKLAYFQDQAALEKLLDKIGKMIQGIAAINTIPAKILNQEGKQALSGEGRLISGVCGSGIKWAGLDMVKRLKEIREQKSLNFVIIGVGGVFSLTDYQEYKNSGADAVMSATGAMWNALLAQEIKKSLNK